MGALTPERHVPSLRTRKSFRPSCSPQSHSFCAPTSKLFTLPPGRITAGTFRLSNSAHWRLQGFGHHKLQEIALLDHPFHGNVDL